MSNEKQFVRLDYFKGDGTFYRRGWFQVAANASLHAVVNRVEAMKYAGRLPGLAPGDNDYHILVRLPESYQFQDAHFIPLT